eukprot:CAMPEP_0204330364 /NCGR_PEP_ID=MMETSP0469-20131031/14868_1 /ASSEMBLY_ACC=CAM_ASM_000384 /TAXON_ID=2969 /ORGANISM="Oxyrrhis marina" /LENGTH=64 /DNA_ID=CAMNT_0051313147 /DNA_START=1 /DNA_END=191 /DNA_ORIENTATION=+
MDTEITVCCVRLPLNSQANDPRFLIWAPRGALLAQMANSPLVPLQQIKSVPGIVRGNYWQGTRL